MVAGAFIGIDPCHCLYMAEFFLKYQTLPYIYSVEDGLTDMGNMLPGHRSR